MENNIEELHFKAVRSSAFLFCFAATSFSLSCGRREMRVKAVSLSTPLSPVCVRADLHHSWPLSIQHLHGVGQVEEVKLHVDGSWRILPGVEGLRAILQHHLLWGETKGQWVTYPPRLKQNVWRRKKKKSTHSLSCFIIIWPFYCCPKNLLNMFTSWMFADSVPAGGWEGVRVIFLPTVEKRLVNLNPLETILNWPNTFQMHHRQQMAHPAMKPSQICVSQVCMS